MKQIYLDTAAATPLDGGVRQAMVKYFSTDFGNPSSLHRPGVTAKLAVEEAREKAAMSLAAHPDEIIFTGGGTEANNLAILGLTGQAQRGHIITSVIEHASVLEPCRALEREGWLVTYLPVEPDGLINPKFLVKALRPDTVLVSVAYANNEIGVIQPIREIAKVIRHFKKLQADKLQVNSYPFFHTDACQTPRFLDLDVRRLGVDLMTINSGKIYGPKGVGCLYVRRGLRLAPLQVGGGQERGLRSGTENVAGIVGFAAALELCGKLREKESVKLTKLRDYFIDRLLKFGDVTLNGSLIARLPNNVNVSFVGADSEYLVLNLDALGVAASSGSACSVHTEDSSYVIKALGDSKEQARGAVRFTLGRDTTKEDLNYVLKILPGILERARVGL